MVSIKRENDGFGFGPVLEHEHLPTAFGTEPRRGIPRTAQEAGEIEIARFKAPQTSRPRPNCFLSSCHFTFSSKKEVNQRRESAGVEPHASASRVSPTGYVWRWARRETFPQTAARYDPERYHQFRNNHIPDPAFNTLYLNEWVLNGAVGLDNTWLTIRKCFFPRGKDK